MLTYVHFQDVRLSFNPVSDRCRQNFGEDTNIQTSTQTNQRTQAHTNQQMNRRKHTYNRTIKQTSTSTYVHKCICIHTYVGYRSLVGP